jgi:flavin reductase (DIM6/NTAB) family NADH-FMN oxidoreductase RutF
MKEINLSDARFLLYPKSVVLVTSKAEDKENVLSVAWHMPTSHNPPLVLISIAFKRFSYELIKKSGEFVINIPPKELAEAVELCGTLSGKEVDKFEVANITKTPSKKVSAPSIKECIAHVECRVVDSFVTGDHEVFVGEVVYAQADEEAFEKNSFTLKKKTPLLFLGGNKYTFCVESFEPKRK